VTQSVGPKRIRAMQRHRRSVERMITESLPPDDTNSSLDTLAFGRTFDVHAAREYGRRLVAMADEQAVFEDWTRAQGLGPDNRERGAFVAPGCLHCPAPGSIKGAAECRRACDCGYGGWPGKLARAYAKIGAKRSAAAGRTLARAGQRLLDMLDMLDGRCSWAPRAPVQPSECQECAGDGSTHYVDPYDGHIEDVSCRYCRGTGHNLAGVVPPIEWSPAVRRRLADMPVPGPVPPAFEGDDWIDSLIRDGGQALLDARDTPLTTVLRRAPSPDPARSLAYLAHVERAIANGRRPLPVVVPVARSLTRVVPRGEHISMGHDPETASDLCRGWAPLITNSASGPGPCPMTDDQREDAMPAWRRGEIRHGKQRSEKKQ
jgi:hypothetical protein